MWTVQLPKKTFDFQGHAGVSNKPKKKKTEDGKQVSKSGYAEGRWMVLRLRILCSVGGLQCMPVMRMTHGEP